MAAFHSIIYGRFWVITEVPSVPSPESVNYLFNPLHPDAKGVAIEWCKWIKYDKRLFHLPETK